MKHKLAVHKPGGGGGDRPIAGKKKNNIYKFCERSRYLLHINPPIKDTSNKIVSTILEFNVQKTRPICFKTNSVYLHLVSSTTVKNLAISPINS